MSEQLKRVSTIQNSVRVSVVKKLCKSTKQNTKKYKTEVRNKVTKNKQNRSTI